MLEFETACEAPPLARRDVASCANRAAMPAYDRRALEPGIVHFGVGGFHRAHQAVYLDELAALEPRGAQGIVGVGLRNPEMRNVLASQDNLFTVVERDGSSSSARVIGSIIRYLYAPDDREAVVEALADPRTRIVTMTITANGYPVSAATGDFDDTHQAAADLCLGDDAPQTVFGFIVEALARRRRRGLPPFTVLSCDNLPDSGRASRTAVTGIAELRDPAIAAWIAEHGAFPSAVVDRITPSHRESACEFVSSTYGIEDQWPVVTEPFRQWIVADEFCNGRPRLDLAGAEFVTDVGPHKLIKTRLLNGSHCALGYLGWLLGHRDTADAMADPLVARYVQRLIMHETAPLLPAARGIDLRSYGEQLCERFSNAAVGDSLDRLCARGSTKMASYLLPSLVEARRARSPHQLLLLAVAAWCRYLTGTDLDGEVIDVRDDRAQELRVAAVGARNDSRRFLQLVGFDALADDAVVAREVTQAIREIDTDGLRHVTWRALERSRNPVGSISVRAHRPPTTPASRAASRV